MDISHWKDRFAIAAFGWVPKWVTPNVLTWARLVLALCIFFPNLTPGWLLAIVIVSYFTDGLDGTFARVRNQGSKFGEAFDPFVDKVLFTGILYFIFSRNYIAPEYLVPIIIPEIFLLLGAAVYAKKFLTQKMEIKADAYGKYKAVTHMPMFLALFFWRAYNIEVFSFVFWLFLFLSYITSSVSFISYLKRLSESLAASKSKHQKDN